MALQIRRALNFAATQCVLFVFVSHALAASDFWAAATTDYFDNNARWTDGSRPTTADSATFNQAGTYEVRFDEGTFGVYGGEPEINDLSLTAGNVTFYTSAGTTRSLIVDGTGGLSDIALANGTMNVGSALGSLNMEADGILWVESNATVNVTNNSRLVAGLLGLIRTGGSLNVSAGADVLLPGGVNLGTDGNGTIVVDHPGSTFETNELALWGGGGGTATGVFRNSATGTFTKGLLLVSNAGPGSQASLDVQSNADVSVTGEFSLGEFGGAGNVASLNVSGSGSTVTHSDTAPLLVGHSSTGAATINVGIAATGGLVTASNGLTIHKTGTVNFGTATNTGTLLANGNITVNGGVLQRGTLGSLVLLPGVTVDVLNGGRASYAGSYSTTNNIYNVSGLNSKLEATTFFQIGNGATVNVTSSGLVTAPSYIDIGTTGNGTLTATGTGSQISGGNTTSYWGDSGHTAIVTLSNNAAATFSTGVEMARSATAGTAATLDVLTGADVTLGLLRVGANGGASTTGVVNVQGSGSTITQSGTSLTVGHTSTGTATINIGTTSSGAIFTTSSTTITINKTGVVNVGGAGTSGTFNVNNNMTISGGLLQRGTTGVFALQTGRSLTVNNGGRATFNGSYSTPTNTSYFVSGVDSRLETTAHMEIRNGATVSVSGGGALSVGSYLDIGIGGNGTLNATGTGTTVLSPGFMWWGSGGSSANLTFSDNATGVFSGIQMARTTTAGTTANVSVLTGADVTVGSLSIAADGGTTTSGTLNVEGTGSTVAQISSSPLTVGHASTGTATINVGTIASGASFTTGTGAVTINRRGTINVGGVFTTGAFNLKGNAAVNGQINVRAGSQMVIDAGKSLSLVSGGTLPNDGMLKGAGIVAGTVLNDGVVEPGDSVGTLTIDGNYTQQSSGTLIAEIASTASFDRLVVTQHAALSGQILLRLLGGFTPTAGDSFDLIDWNSVGGAFNVFQYPGLPAGLDWDFSQISTTGVVSVVNIPVLPGDYNEDGSVDAADYTVWRDKLGSATTLPNDDTAGVGPDDYTRWKNNFGNQAGSGSLSLVGTRDGGSSSGKLVPVPEPVSSTQLLLLTSAFLAIRRRSLVSKQTRHEF
jgi:fibronectin-binding autotransporter adhesin